MAKYTELLAEYLKDGGTLPAVFDDIDGLKNLFVGRYIERELGFETPELFSIKLEYKANLLIPVYKRRMDELQAAYEAQSNPIKTRIRMGSLQRVYGEKNGTNTTAPNTIRVGVTPYPTAGNLVAGERIPNEITETVNPQQEQTNHSDSYTDTENYQDITDKEEGATLTEALQRLQNAERAELKNLMEELLSAFEPLFMRVW